jgi:hypothetical protein
MSNNSTSSVADAYMLQRVRCVPCAPAKLLWLRLATFQLQELPVDSAKVQATLQRRWM